MSKYKPNHIEGNCDLCAKFCNGKPLFAKDFPYLANFMIQFGSLVMVGLLLIIGLLIIEVNR